MDAQLDAKALDWLLEADPPGARYLTLRDLLDLPADDPELLAARKAAHRFGPIAAILERMDPAGYWCEAGCGYNPKYFSTVWALINLAQLGARIEEDARLVTACNYLLDHALTQYGQFTASGTPSGTADCLQGNLCWALAEMGMDEPRIQKAFDWTARSVTGEGIASMEEKDAPIRYYAGKCGPGFACGANLKMPCAWGAVKVLLALSKVPQNQHSRLVTDAIRAGVDFLFSVDPATAAYPAAYTGKPSQSWWKFGFPVFYVTDILQIVEALTALGFGNDPRLIHALELVRSKQGSLGRWSLEYDYSGKTWVDYGIKKQPNKWVTLRALRVFKRIESYDHPFIDPPR